MGSYYCQVSSIGKIFLKGILVKHAGGVKNFSSKVASSKAIDWVVNKKGKIKQVVCTSARSVAGNYTWQN